MPMIRKMCLEFIARHSDAAVDLKISNKMNINKPISRELVLYTLLGCHLCEKVSSMLHDMGLEWTATEIDTDPELEQKYDIHIPVLFLPDTGKELFYPFNESQVEEFLELES